ncbi:hypothetical protein [Actinokineospora pegani]|uniref:hypothetical protein n=1 Tax=Actinokineospora pegani TaxID=2654637 RepID=UPI0012EAEA5F|nr:hypothetical protein [Actinokineospora pegani]
MNDNTNGNTGYQVEPDLLGLRITALTELVDLTGELVATASGLAERLPLLGTAPPAAHLAERLREAAGPDGLVGEIQAAERDVREFQRTLAQAKHDYGEQESDAESAFRSVGDRL